MVVLSGISVVKGVSKFILSKVNITLSKPRIVTPKAVIYTRLSIGLANGPGRAVTPNNKRSGR